MLKIIFWCNHRGWWTAHRGHNIYAKIAASLQSNWVLHSQEMGWSKSWCSPTPSFLCKLLGNLATLTIRSIGHQLEKIYRFIMPKGLMNLTSIKNFKTPLQLADVYPSRNPFNRSLIPVNVKHKKFNIVQSCSSCSMRDKRYLKQ